MACLAGQCMPRKQKKQPGVACITSLEVAEGDRSGQAKPFLSALSSSASFFCCSTHCVRVK